MGPLYARSEYSLLQSVLRIEEYVKTCLEYGFSYATLSDHNVLFGIKHFDALCKKYNIKPIFGMEIDVSVDQCVVCFELIALNSSGFKQMMALSSLLTKQSISLNDLNNINDCALIAFNCDGIYENSVVDENEEQFMYIKQTIDQIHPNHNYLALTHQQANYWAKHNQTAYMYALKANLKCLAINKTKYLTANDEQANYVMGAIYHDKLVSDPSLGKDKDRYLLTMDQYYQYYSKDILDNNDQLAAMVDFNLELLKTSLPKYPLKDQQNSGQYLSKLAVVGLCKRLNVTKLINPYASRLKYELDIIHQMGFDDYFLIVYDYILYAKKHHILVGPGRGSAAGSLVSYAIGITEIDPIHYGLIFERFLNPARASMPDIDTDFPDNRRDEVIEYVVNKYGKDHVAHILTFGTLAAKQSIRDVGKAYGLNTYEIDKVVRCIPNTVKVTIQDAINQSVALRQMMYENNTIAQVVQIAQQLEGLPRHCSTHAGGIVFSALPFKEVAPTIYLDDSMETTQYTMEYLEDMGLIKMDFLGLRNLTILDSIEKMIQQSHPEFKIKSIPLNDAKTYQLISQANTIGVFQLESEGMKNLLLKLKPKCFDDIVAAVALFRPGPMELIPIYLKNRATQTTRYPNDAIKNVLQQTYGVMVYQEQVMQIAQIIANFSMGQADMLRKAMSKKKPEELHQMRMDFVKGATANGYSEQAATHWFDLIEKFAGYGFNKAHSVCYGLIAYQLAYLKVNAPYPFYTAYLNSILGANDKINLTLQELTRLNIPILPPDINDSHLGFTLCQQGIRFALLSIKGIGTVVGKEIINDRQVNGPYTSFFNAVARLNAIKCSASMIESLIDAGALDTFNANRYSMKLSLNDALKYADLIVMYHPNGSYYLNESLLSTPSLTVAKEDMYLKAMNEVAALGVFLTINPFANMRKQLNLNIALLSQIMEKGEGTYIGFGMITRIKQHRTKKGDMMAFVSLMDESGTYQASIMPGLYQKIQAQLEEKTYCQVELKLNSKGAIINQAKLMNVKG